MYRQYGVLDSFIIEADKAVTTLLGTPVTTDRVIPDHGIEDEVLSEQERKYSIALMRVNHAGEIAAQALYQGQALTAKLPGVKESMEQAATEENDHLVWCKQRLNSLGGRTSLLNPFWYVGSFTIGAIAGKVGDEWSLGFVAETENQVVRHIDSHLTSLSDNDKKSRAILEQMKTDELHHGSEALKAGGKELPQPIKLAMGLVSKVMTKSSLVI